MGGGRRTRTPPSSASSSGCWRCATPSFRRARPRPPRSSTRCIAHSLHVHCGLFTPGSQLATGLIKCSFTGVYHMQRKPCKPADVSQSMPQHGPAHSRTTRRVHDGATRLRLAGGLSRRGGAGGCGQGLWLLLPRAHPARRQGACDEKCDSVAAGSGTLRRHFRNNGIKGSLLAVLAARL